MLLLLAGTAALLLVAACGGSSPATAAVMHRVTPSGQTRAAILQAADAAFFSATGAPPALRLGQVEEVRGDAQSWATATIVAAPGAPAETSAALADGHGRGLLRGDGSAWQWLGYLGGGDGACSPSGASVPSAAAHLLGITATCSRTPLPSPATTAAAAPAPTPSAGARATVSAFGPGDLATLLSIFVSTKNSGPAGQVLTPSTIVFSTHPNPQAATVAGSGEWAVVTYVPAAGAPEPLTEVQLQDGAGTAFYLETASTGWTLRGLAGSPACSGATAAGVPSAVLTLWGYHC